MRLLRCKKAKKVKKTRVLKIRRSRRLSTFLINLWTMNKKKTLKEMLWPLPQQLSTPPTTRLLTKNHLMKLNLVSTIMIKNTKPFWNNTMRRRNSNKNYSLKSRRYRKMWTAQIKCYICRWVMITPLNWDIRTKEIWCFQHATTPRTLTFDDINVCHNIS